MNKQVTRHTPFKISPFHPPQQTTTYHLPSLMDYIELVPPAQEQQRNDHDCPRTAMVSINYANTLVYS